MSDYEFRQGGQVGRNIYCGPNPEDEIAVAVGALPEAAEWARRIVEALKARQATLKVPDDWQPTPGEVVSLNVPGGSILVKVDEIKDGYATWDQVDGGKGVGASSLNRFRPAGEATT
jgi:hypothetical protein